MSKKKKKLALHFRIIVGMVAGLIYAFVSSYFGWNEFTTNWIDPFGTIFLRLLKFIALPLVLFSIISGISGLTDISKLGRMGAKTLAFYLVTTVFAISLGLLLVNLFKPGDSLDISQRVKNRMHYELWVEETAGVHKLDSYSFMSDPEYLDIRKDVLRNLGEKRRLEDDKALEEKIKHAKRKKEETPLVFLVNLIPENLVYSLSNNKLMLQVIFFSIFFGIAMLFSDPKSVAPIKLFFDGMNNIFLRMVNIIMEFAPYFVFALMAGVISKMADTPAEVYEILKTLGAYTLVVILGLLTMIFVVYPLLVTSIVRKLKYKSFFNNISPAQLMAFSTSSSAATLPVTMECLEDNMKVSKNVAGFVLPIGATVNMDGTSMYQAIAVVFLAQMHMVDLSIGQQLTIVFTATLASIGSAAVPSAGLVMLIIVLQSVGLNPAWIAIIFPVDRILDMIRTTVNVTGDASVATIIANSENEIDLKHVNDYGG
jgi:Na+/H+-dicarboxylate symporter